MKYYGDLYLGSTLDFKFTTIDAGIPTSISGSVIAAYPNNSMTEVYAGITLTPDFDSRVGLNHVRVVMSAGNGYAANSNYDLIVVSGTVAGKSVAGYVVGSFSIEARPALIVTGTITTVTGNVNGNVVGNVLGNVNGSVTSVASPVTVGTNNDKTGYSLSSPQFYDRIGNTTGTVTNVLNVVNPVNLVTGTYISNLANLDAAVSTRASQASLDTLDDYVDTEVAAIKAKTDQLTFTKANELDANVQSVNDKSVTGDGSAGNPWGPA